MTSLDSATLVVGSLVAAFLAAGCGGGSSPTEPQSQADIPALAASYSGPAEMRKYLANGSYFYWESEFGFDQIVQRSEFIDATYSLFRGSNVVTVTWHGQLEPGGRAIFDSHGTVPPGLHGINLDVTACTIGTLSLFEGTATADRISLAATQDLDCPGGSPDHLEYVVQLRP